MYYNMNKTNNGRVSIIEQPDISNLFSMYDKIPANQCVTYRNPTIGQWTDTPLSNAFFSKENIQIIQNGIRAGVYYKSKKQYVVGQQDCDSLKVIMRSVFLQHAKNLPNDIPQQVDELNKIVLDYCIFHVYSEAQSYVKYLHDVTTLAVPMALPIIEVQKDKNNYVMPSPFG